MGWGRTEVRIGHEYEGFGMSIQHGIRYLSSTHKRRQHGLHSISHIKRGNMRGGVG